MATARESDEESTSDSDSDFSFESDSDGNSDVEADYQREPCKFYNSGGCKDGDRCSYLHVCKYALKGNCRYGAKCKLNHSRAGQSSSAASNRTRNGEEEEAPRLADGRHYQWQLNDGQGWMDIDNDHVIEAQYSLPHTKSIKIYNTPFGAVSIDFSKIRVYGKSLRVRRLDDGKTVWIWYCTLGHKWHKYGGKGNGSPVSSDIEKKFQSNSETSFTFTIGTESLEIRFREMRQVSQNRRRKVTRRPVYRQKQAGARAQAIPSLQNLSLGTKPLWQFRGKSGNWYDFKRRRGSSTECSVKSDDIEKKYQQNQSASMLFTVNGSSYKLDFGAMKQTNLTTKRSHDVRRVLK